MAFQTVCQAWFPNLAKLANTGGRGGGGGVTSIHNKRRCAILTKKVATKNLGTYLKLRQKNPGTRNAKLSVYMRKLTTQIRKSLILTPHFSFTYFIYLFCFMMFVQRVLNFPQPLSVFPKINIMLPLWVTFIMLGSSPMNKVS